MNKTVNTPCDDVEEARRLLALQRAAQLSDGPPSAEQRIDRIDRCITLLRENAAKFEEAINSDFGNRSRHATAITDVMSPIGALQDSRKNLRNWMRNEKRHVEPRLLGFLGAKSEIRFQPKGVVGVIAPWNFPVGLVFSPLAGVLAAGNRALVKPSEFTPATSEILRQTISKFFAEDELAVVTGGAEVGSAFSAMPFDHLVFTGAGSIAKHVMRAAAENLVPLTLELGGKSPVILGQTADLTLAAARIMAGKTLNAGQICLAPDHVYVPAAMRETFVAKARQATEAMFPTLKDNPDYTAMISERHFERVRHYVDDARTKGATIIEINPSKENFNQQEHRRIPPTLILDATREMAVMQDEIFGPLLPIITCNTIAHAIDQINAHDRPLALYYFGSDKDEQERIINSTTSGGVCINDVIMHCAQENLPFGGIGPSGMGAYHGIDGFREFSHRKAIYAQLNTDLGPMKLFRPPYGAKLRRMLDKQIG